MTEIHAFPEKGRFYKGNLHAHSTRSDGRLTVDELTAQYRAKGYHFLAVTDHSLYSAYREFDRADFITIQGVEANLTPPAGDSRAYHFIAIPGSLRRQRERTKPFYTHGERLETPEYAGTEDIQRFIDDLYGRGYFVMCNHPYWSRIEYDDILRLRHLSAIEVYNHCSQVLENTGESNACWDALLRNGLRVFGAAVDDNHNQHPLDSPYLDSFGGFIMVKAEGLTEQEICEAISAGHFYSSMGPEIYDLRIRGDEVTLRCSPVQRIFQIGDVRQFRCQISAQGDSVTEYRGRLFGDEKYVRFELYDSENRKAYTNPVWLIP